MKFVVQLCLALGLGILAMSFSGEPAKAQPVPECIDIPEGDPAKMASWWNRRSADEKKYISELPCEQRYIPMVCIFLFEPDLRGCTNKGVAEYRADKACTAEGHALLSEAHASCKERFKQTFVPPFA